MRRILSVLMILLLILGTVPVALAAQADAPLSQGDEITVSAVLHTGTAYAAENMRTLRYAFTEAEEGKHLTVTVSQPGTYYVGDGNASWRLRSDTTFDLNGATLIRYGSQGNLIQNCDYSGQNTTGGGYTLSHDITIKNGTIDGAGDTGATLNLCNLGHADGIRLENLTFKNGNSHLVEFSGCRNCTVTGCTFRNFCPRTDEAVEALQFDISDNSVSKTSWNGVYYSDSTVCRNMTVEGCTFIDYPSGVGNHKGILGNHNTGIVVRDSTFTTSFSSTQPAIWCYDFDDSEISGNTVSGSFGTGVYVSACRNTAVKKNNITLAGTGVYVTLANSYTRGKVDVRTEEHCEGCVVDNNTVKATGANIGVCVYSGSGVSSFSGNSVTSASGTGVTFSSNSKVGTVKNNTIKAPKDIGMLIATSAQVTDVNGNTITSKDQGIQVSSSSTVKYIRNSKTVTSTAANGIYVSSATAQNITGNTVKDCGVNGIMVTSSGVTSAVNSNTVTGCAEYGIRVNNSNITISFDKNTLTGNKVGASKINAKIKPAAPVISSLTCVYDGVSVKWSASTGAAKYRVFTKSGSSWKKLADTTATSYVDKKAASGTNCAYTVRCISADGKSYTSDYDTVGKSLYYVAAPRISSLSNVAGGTKLAWASVNGGVKYKVFVKTGTSGWKAAAETAGTSYTYTGVKGGAAYLYTVRCMDANGKYVSAYNTSGWKYTYIDQPALPTLKNTKNGVQVTITKPKGASYVRIFRKTGSGKWTKLADTSSTSYVDKSAKKGTKYSYTVRVINKDGTKYLSAYNTTGRTITCKR